MRPPDSGGLIGAGAAGASGVAAHIVPTFQVQIHPEMPVSIVCVIPGSLVSPQVHVQFHVHTDGTVAPAVVTGPEWTVQTVRAQYQPPSARYQVPRSAQLRLRCSFA